jgi:glycosyltransferase involved in cell wall biosynthesis
MHPTDRIVDPSRTKKGDQCAHGNRTNPVLSVVVPVYGCQSCIRRLHERLTATLQELDTAYEIILVDDRAEDGSWPEIERLAYLDGAVRGILLSRNFGQHAAITAGIRYARGTWVAVMDCDLQDPPEDIPRLFAKAMEGYDIVFGRRTHKKQANLPRRLLGILYYWGLRTFASANTSGEFGTLSILSRKSVDAFLELRDNDRHYTLALLWLGFKTAVVDYDPAPRFTGRSSYSFQRLLKLALDGVFFQTTFLLRLVVYLGFGFALIGGGLSLYLIYGRLVGHVYPGWTGIVVAMLLQGGFIILSTGVTGLYIGKVFEQSRGRPLFVVDRITDDVGSDSQVGRQLSNANDEVLA